MGVNAGKMKVCTEFSNINIQEARFLVNELKIVNNKDEFSSTPIFHAICKKNVLTVLSYIRAGHNVNMSCEKSGGNYLHHIIQEASPFTETEYVPFIYQLSNYDIDLDATDKNGFTPLQLTIKHRLLDLMVALIKCGAKCRPEEDEKALEVHCGPFFYKFRSAYRKFSPGLWLTIEKQQAFKVSKLVKSWCRINIRKGGTSLIEVAKQRGVDEKITMMLLKGEASVEFAHATLAGDEDRMRYLLNHYHIDLTIKDCSHQDSSSGRCVPLTLYEAARKYGHRHVLYLLRK